MEDRLEDICAYKIQAERTAFPTRELESCRACSGYDEECLNYLRVANTELPRRMGKFYLDSRVEIKT